MNDPDRSSCPIPEQVKSGNFVYQRKVLLLNVTKIQFYLLYQCIITTMVMISERIQCMKWTSLRAV